MTTEILKVAGALGILALGASRLFRSEETVECDGFRQRWPHSFQNSAYVASVAEALQLFISIDAQDAGNLMEAHEKLATAYWKLRTESVRPGFLAGALVAKTETLRRLRLMVRRARQERAVHADELSEEFTSFERHVNDLAHNCMQQSALNAMNGFA